MPRARSFILSLVLIAGAACVSVQAQTTCQVAKLLGTDETGAGQLGASVALSGDGSTLIAGAPNDGSGVGAAFVYVRSSSTGAWVQQGAKLLPTGGVGAGKFGNAVALSNDGNIALVGAFEDNSQFGAAYVFVRAGTSWSQQAKLLPSNAVGSMPLFGYAVALDHDGEYALIGAILDAGGAGAAYVFRRTGTVWSQQSRRTPTGAIGLSAFGASVALDNKADFALIGAPQDNTGVGAAHVHARNSSVWFDQAKLTPTGGVGNGAFGISVALDGFTASAIVGAHSDNGGIGAVYGFTRSGVTWSQLGTKVSPAGASPNASFGVSLALTPDGTAAIVGAEGDSSLVGAAYRLLRVGSQWVVQSPKIVPVGAVGTGRFGISVASSDTLATIAIGAYQDNTFVGAAYLLGIEAPITISQQPVGAVVSLHAGNAMYTVAAASSVPFWYQWRRNAVNLANGPLPSGATAAGAQTPTLSLSGVTDADNGAAFDCVLFGACNSVRSDPAGLDFSPICRADFNASGAKSVQDLFDFLAAFFAPCP